MGKNRYKKILNHLKSEEIDCKIKTLNERMTTSGIYLNYGMDSGTPAVPEIPAIPAVPPTYVNVDPGGISNPNDFVWGDQGDGSNPNAPLNIPANLYTTYNGEQVAAVRQIEGEYPGGVTPLAFVTRATFLSTTLIGYLGSGGFVQMAARGPFGGGSLPPLNQSYLDAYDNLGSGLFQYYTTKTIYLWSGLDYLFGSAYPAAQYYPPGRTNETTPKADYGLYGYNLYIPLDANGNVLPNRIMTDPGSPEVPAVPGIPAIPPKQVITGRNNLGDPNYYPGPAQPQGEIAQLRPAEVGAMLDIIRGTPGTPDAKRARDTLDKWARPGSKNRDILIKMGVLEGASLPTQNYGNVAQVAPIDNTPPPGSNLEWAKRFPVGTPSPGTNVELQKAAERAYKRMGLKGA